MIAKKPFIKTLLGDCKLWQGSTGHSCVSFQAIRDGQVYLAAVCPCDCHHARGCGRQQGRYSLTVDDLSNGQLRVEVVRRCCGTRAYTELWSGSRAARPWLDYQAQARPR